MPDIRLQALRKQFGTLSAVDGIDACFPEGSVTCLLGASGCGKTTLMRLIAGLETPTSGRVLFGDRDVTRLPPRRREVGMVFQYPVMYRPLSVEDNIRIALAGERRLSPAERQTRLDEVLDVLSLTPFRREHMAALDMGTRQKVAVGRAIARRCDVILFDEPTTNVEVNAKLALIRAFKQFRQRFRQTIIYVTHDQTEAMTLADQIALMQDGRISQCTAPNALYEQPDTEFGGWFLGSPGMNFLTPSGERAGGLVFDGVAEPVACPAGGANGLRLGIRPEYVSVGGTGPVRGRVLRRSITIGGQILVSLAVGESRLKAKLPRTMGLRPEGEVAVSLSLPHAVFFRDGVRLTEAPRAHGKAHVEAQS